MSASLQREPLTSALLARLRTGVQIGGADALVGDMVMPPGGGWTTGPNAPGDEFTPYLLLVPMTASGAGATGTLADPQGDWKLPYSLTSVGAAREQCEWMADQARNALTSLRTEVFALGPDSYKVQQVWTDSIGGLSRSAASDPAIFTEVDQLTIWLGKVRTR